MATVRHDRQFAQFLETLNQGRNRLLLPEYGHLCDQIVGFAKHDGRPVKDAYPQVQRIGGLPVVMPGGSGATDASGFVEIGAPAGILEIEAGIGGGSDTTSDVPIAVSRAVRRRRASVRATRRARIRCLADVEASQPDADRLRVIGQFGDQAEAEGGTVILG